MAPLKTEVPELLNTLVAEGRWPVSADAARLQNLSPYASAENVRRIAPEESRIYLYPPPFHTVQDEISGDHPFWKDPRARVAELDPARVVLLGDFGPGSDAPLILDYAADASGPTVRRLRWNPDGSTQWVLVSNTFEEFLAALGL